MAVLLFLLVSAVAPLSEHLEYIDFHYHTSWSVFPHPFSVLQASSSRERKIVSAGSALASLISNSLTKTHLDFMILLCLTYI